MSVSEIKYPQRIRGGAGYFPEEGRVILEGYTGAWLAISGLGDTDNGNQTGGIVQRVGALELFWKRAGSSDHPAIGRQNLQDAIYRQTGYPEIGFDTKIEFTIEILDPQALGSGPSGKGWYFYPALDILKPNFDRGSAQSTGTFQLWVNDGHKDIVGGCKWSRNVGSGIDGILLNIDRGTQPVSENYPLTWPKGSKIRVGIDYWVPA